MSEDFYRPVRAEVIKANDVEKRERAVRLYCTSSDRTWSLQVRSPARLRDGRDGKDFLIASASLSKEDMSALREAIDRLMGEGGE